LGLGWSSVSSKSFPKSLRYFLELAWISLSEPNSNWAQVEHSHSSSIRLPLLSLGTIVVCEWLLPLLPFLLLPLLLPLLLLLLLLLLMLLLLTTNAKMQH